MLIELPKAVQDDILPLQEMISDTVLAICSKDYDSKHITAWVDAINNTSKWETRLKEQFMLVALTGDKVIGLVSLQNNVYVDLLYVHKDYQHKAVASQLSEKIVGQAITKGSTVLESDVSKTEKPFF